MFRALLCSSSGGQNCIIQHLVSSHSVGGRPVHSPLSTCALEQAGVAQYIETHHGLDGPGIESRWRRDFPHPSRPSLGLFHPPIQWLPGLPPRVKRPERGFDHPPLSSPEVNPLNAQLNPICHLLALLAHHILHVSGLRVKETVERYLYSPSGPSWPVIMSTSPLPTTQVGLHMKIY